MDPAFTASEAEVVLCEALGARDPELLRIGVAAVLECPDPHAAFRSAVALAAFDTFSVYREVGRLGAPMLVAGLLSSEEYALSGHAALALGGLGDARALPQLLAAAQRGVPYAAWAIAEIEKAGSRTPEPLVLLALDARQRLVGALLAGRRVEPEDASRLVALLEREPRVVRERALERLAGMGRAAADALFAALGSGLALRSDMIRLMGSLRDPRGLPFLARALGDDHHRNADAVRALAVIGGAAAVEILNEGLERFGPSETVAVALRAIGPPAVAPLLEAFELRPRIRRECGELLARVAGPQSAPALDRALDDRSRSVRESAEKGLGLLGAAAVPALVERLREPRPARTHALRILGQLGDAAALGPIAEIARRGVPEERRIALQALGGFTDDGAFELLSAALAWPDRTLRRQAASGLGRQPGERAIARLAAAWSDLDEAAQLAVLRALFFRAAPPAEVPAIVGVALRALAGGVDAVVQQASSLLCTLEPADLVEPLLTTALVAAAGAFRELLSGVISKRAWHRRPVALDDFARAEQELPLKVPPKAAMPAAPPAEAPTPPPTHVVDALQFSVTAPRVSRPGTAFLLDVWAHLEDDRDAILRRAREAQRGPVSVRSKGPIVVARGSTLVVGLRLPAFGIDGLTDAILWTGAVGNATFPIEIPQGTPAGSHVGDASVTVEGVPIARIHFCVDVGPPIDEPIDVTNRAFTVKTAFASYASEERDAVLARIQGMLKLLPKLDVFVDVVSLRSGERWEQSLMEEIEARDVFYLFWSRAASLSRWVDREWRTALALRGLEVIDPVPLEPAAAAPPPELASLHFNEWTLRFIGSAGPAGLA